MSYSQHPSPGHKMNILSWNAETPARAPKPAKAITHERIFGNNTPQSPIAQRRKSTVPMSSVFDLRPDDTPSKVIHHH